MSPDAAPAMPPLAGLLRTQLGVEQRIFWRNRSGVFFTFVFPLLLLGFLGVFSDAELLVPGICALVIVSVSFQGLAIQLSMHRDMGVLKRIMATPLPAQVFVAGKVLSISIVALVEVVLVLFAGLVFYDVPAPAHPAVLAAGVLFGVAAFVALGFAVASAIGSGESAPAITNAVYLPMMFISGVFYPVDRFPQAVQVLAQALPLTPLVDIVRSSWTGPWDGVPYGSFAALAAWCVLGTAYTARRFRWEPGFER